MTPTRKIGIGAFLLGSVVGGAIGVNGLASAASNDTSTTATTVADDSSSTTTDATDDTSGTDTSATVTSDTGDEPSGPHTANGITEEVLTGDTASSVEAAVLAANPGATIERMETDAEGAVYEAHVTLADGSRATVKLDASFAVTGTEAGPDGHGGGHGHGSHDADDDDVTTDTSTTS
jgi:uncharacterized membrane protein YkoI